VHIPEAQNVIKNIWDEAFKILKPKTIHIGFDEIGMIGFHWPREKEIDLWKIQMPFMANYAQKSKAHLMIWGDMGLGPGEGPDALNGRTNERAAIIRSTIPIGTYVADWHYINNSQPDIYKPSLEIWQKNNNIPIAAPWLHPNNIYGFIHAAISKNVGILQTTWADFESNEQNMIANIEQFGAYILALDYAWSGRPELPENLPYNPVHEWCQRFYRQSLPIKKLQRIKINASLGTIDSCNIAELQDKIHMSLSFNKTLSQGYAAKAQSSHIFIEGQPLAKLKCYNNGVLIHDKILRYGVEVRSLNDLRPIMASTPGKDKSTYYHFFIENTEIDEIVLESLHPCSSLLIQDIMLFAQQ